MRSNKRSQACAAFIDQVPPMYSAKKVGGKKLYEMARRGEVIEREPVRICIHELEAIKPDGQLVKDNLDGTFDFSRARRLFRRHIRARTRRGLR